MPYASWRSANTSYYYYTFLRFTYLNLKLWYYCIQLDKKDGASRDTLLKMWTCQYFGLACSFPSVIGVTTNSALFSGKIGTVISPPASEMRRQSSTESCHLWTQNDSHIDASKFTAVTSCCHKIVCQLRRREAASLSFGRRVKGSLNSIIISLS